ncbi:MAG: hypothetical protein CK546_00825 [Pedosphaera sp.]|nr:hypothetical protein [Pedosphaera sp.]PHX95760.1 MAG: hypothetical protein CK546_00825 [Pedosphaera sp.]
MKTVSFKALSLLVAVLLVEGCRRKKPEPLAPAPDAPAASSPAPVVTYQVDASLQQVLVKFYNDNTRPAMSWEDLVGGKYIPAIPLGPDGKPLDWNTTMQRIGKAAKR